MRRLWRWAPVVVLLVFVGAAILYSESLKTRVAIGVKAPDFELDLLAGGVVRSEQYAGKPVFVNFWAAWCPPCLDEMPAHDEFYRRYGRVAEYIAINERETVARIQRHLDEVEELGLAMNLPIALDRRGTVGDAFRLGGMPETWLLDPDGVARQHWVGPITFEQLEAGYRGVMGKTPDAGDGGPFHGTEDAWAVLMSDADLNAVFVAGAGGLAHYDLLGGGAPGDAFQWIVQEDVHALLRDARAPGGLHAVTDADGTGLPAAPANLGRAPDERLLAWVPGHGLFAAEAGDDLLWQAVGTGLALGMPYADLAAAPFTKDHWIMATATGLLESRDGGVSWHATGFKESAFAVAFDPVAPRRLYIAARDGVWVSEDDGRTAARLPASPQRALIALDILPGADGQALLVAAAPNGDVYAGRDGGLRWEALIPGR